MNIAGDKVLLRTAGRQDGALLSGLMQNPGIRKMTGGYSETASCARWMDSPACLPVSPGSLRGIITDKKDTGTGLGIIALSNIDSESKSAEICIKLAGPARGRGYGQDAVNALVSYAFGELGLDCIYASILEYNMASRRLFELCGFTQEGMHKSRADKEGRYRNVCIYRIRRM